MKLLLPFLLYATAATLFGQPSDILLSHNFDNDAEGWVAMGSTAATDVTTKAGAAKRGKGALEFTYDLSKPFAAAILPVTVSLEPMKRIRFWAKSDHDTSVAVLLAEHKPGGDYTAWFWAPAGQWQLIELTPSDFAAGDGPKDPVDPDGKLDLDQLEGIGILDLGYFSNAVRQNGGTNLIIAEASGAHTLLIDDFEVLSSPSPQTSTSVKATPIDGFDRGFLQWMTLGGMKLSLKDKAMEVVYQRAESKIALLTRRLSQMNLARSKGVSFNLASENDAVIAVSIELKIKGGGSGPRYSTTIPVKAGAEAMPVSLNFSDFDHDENSPAGPAALDPAAIKSISIVDINAMMGGELGPNKLWISALYAQ